MIKNSLLSSLILIISVLIRITPVEAQGASISNDAILIVSWSPNGQYIAYGYNDGSIEIIDATDETLIFNFSSGNAPTSSISWSSDGHMLAVGFNNTLYLWDNLDNLPQQPQLIFSSATHQSAIVSLAWNSNNSQLASLSEYGNPNFAIWNVGNGQPTVKSGISQAYALSWNCENNYLITGAGIGIRSISLVNGDVQQIFGEGLLNSVAPDITCSPDGTKIAVSSNLGEILVYDISTGSAILENQFQVEDLVSIVSIDWNFTGEFIAGASRNGIIRVWDITNNILVDTINTATDLIFSIDWNPLSNEILYGGNNSTLEVLQPNTMIESIDALTLINADTDTDIRTLSTTSTETIDIANNISIRADTDPATVGSVVFTVYGIVVATDNSAPYTIAGENGLDILPWNIAPGSHTVVATPYSRADGTGDAGTPLTVQVEIIDSH